MGCWACDRAAVNPRTGRMTNGCQECIARALARSPELFDAEHDGRVCGKYRMLLELHFGDAWQQAHERVKAWAQRMRDVPA